MMSLKPTPIWDGYEGGTPLTTTDTKEQQRGKLATEDTGLGADSTQFEHDLTRLGGVQGRVSGVESAKSFGILIEAKGRGVENRNG